MTHAAGPSQPSQYLAPVAPPPGFEPRRANRQPSRPWPVFAAGVVVGLVIAGAVFGITKLASGSTGHTRTTSSSAPAANSCAALVGQPVNTSVECVAPISGLTSPMTFTCATAPDGNFYYFNLGSKEYVYGISGGNWAALPYTESLGPISNELNCS